MISALLITLLLIKHLICDFFLQTPFQFLNKGRYGHLGGLLHTAITIVGTFVAFCAFLWITNPATYPPILRCGICLGMEALIHYHMDWGKVQLCRIYDLKANNSEWFWYLLGVDQFIHAMTYVLIAIIL